MTPKKVQDDEEEEFEDEDFEDEPEEEEDKFKCRACGKEISVDEGDDLILVCDKCSKNYDIDKIWDDFDSEKIAEENLKSFDLAPYILKKDAKKVSKKK